ncbi:hypothetical protein A6V39_03585 [Candidatus Mycoplasma haematobovis]|uniref:Uncharacterized protein n=1 Tax=Candidatus Mycoplasma haematobovis TaxID=432608 RepID=A0A1A9QCK3_9MOLU|nr:hypothetical protein [Candidatus Mycoplasma haematobovis]OAL09968.1 hypothetical protein A6V39_03585 [Candidatus Mycoplasma haematobovis]
MSRWCVVPISLAAILDKRGSVALVPSNKPKWDKKIKKYRTENNNPLKFDQLQLSQGPGVTDDDYKNIQNKCDSLKNISSYAENFETALNQSELWCSEKLSFAG